VKAFQFRLDPALRWRATQLRLEREGVAQAAGHLAALQTELDARRSELRTGSAELVPAGSAGLAATFASWAAYADRCRRRIRALEDESREARKALALRTQNMVDVHRKLRVLENLKRRDEAGWERKSGREMEAFAGEAYLARLVRERRTAVEARAMAAVPRDPRDNGSTGA
jgi:hypothetical protein